MHSCSVSAFAQHASATVADSPAMLPCFPLCLLPLLLSLLPTGSSCPGGCSCKDSHTIDCQDLGLLQVPSGIFPLVVRKILMSNNQIQEIPADFFMYYGDLVYLDLSNNSLSTISKGTFSTTRLIYLDLRYNNFSRLSSGAFSSARRLIMLRLGNNPKLEEVDKEAFHSLNVLQVLELNDNALETLSVTTISSLPSLRTLRLEGNPWLCNCTFANLFLWLKDNVDILPTGFDAIQCSLPQDRRKITLNELSENSFNECEYNLTLTDYLIIFFSGVCVSITAITTSFFLANIAQCFQRLGLFKDNDDDED
ncbi:leucine-rich repeat-containing protein 38-like [Leucoraja erinacea]|uniref:leucine-rich repeat-containing protein 38-like n=1 Tax=Leucoraja erinaceus TaxID=7782 RepID=UPI002455711F|nr:leucine-rich repeat-containing protein 38-like [Leucoraja erinacea]